VSSRSRARNRKRRQLDKASYAAAARAAGGQTRDMSAQAAAAAAGAVQSGVAIGAYEPLPRELPYTAPFGPLTPPGPYAIDPLRPDGRTDPRVWEYPVGWNVPGGERRHVPFETLRKAADVGIVRYCISLIKSEICGLDWATTVSEDAVTTAMELDGIRKVQAKSALREKLAPDIAKARAFWKRPDRFGGYNFVDWLGMALEESLVLDALAINPRWSYGNDLACEIIAGEFVKPLLDNRGRRPLPPDPAFQQIMYGFPRGEFTAAIGKDGTIDGGLTADELIYCRREVRTISPYGISPVEKALIEINLWLKRADWLTQEFDASSLPMAFLEVPESAKGMTPAEVRRWRAEINNTLSGNLSERQRIQIGLPGGKLATFTDNAQKYKPEYDLFLVKLIAAAFGVTPAEIGFIESGGLGGSSYHEGQENIQYRKLIHPWCKWLAAIFNDINHRYLGVHPAVEFKFLGLEEEDQASADAVLDTQVKGGRRTLNEARDEMGLPPLPIEEADEPFVAYGRGVLFLDGQKAIQEAQGAAARAGSQAAVAGFQAAPAQRPARGKQADESEESDDDSGDDSDAGEEAAPPKPASASDGSGQKTAVAKTATTQAFQEAGEAARQAQGIDGTAGDAQDIQHRFVPTDGEPGCLAYGLAEDGFPHRPKDEAKAVAAELGAFARYATRLEKSGGRSRAFTFTAVPEQLARELNVMVQDNQPGLAALRAKAAVAELAKAGGGGGGRAASPRPDQGAGAVDRLPGARRAEPALRRAGIPGCQPTY